MQRGKNTKVDNHTDTSIYKKYTKTTIKLKQKRTLILKIYPSFSRQEGCKNISNK